MAANAAHTLVPEGTHAVPMVRIPVNARGLALTILAVVGLPIVTALAWSYEITPGGIVLDPDAPARKRKTPQRLAELAALQIHDAAQCLDRLLELSPYGLNLDSLAVNWNRESLAGDLPLDRDLDAPPTGRGIRTDGVTEAEHTLTLAGQRAASDALAGAVLDLSFGLADIRRVHPGAAEPRVDLLIQVGVDAHANIHRTVLLADGLVMRAVRHLHDASRLQA